MESQIPRCKQRGIKLVAQQSSGVFNPCGIRQISMQARLLGSLLRRNKETCSRKRLAYLSEKTKDAVVGETVDLGSMLQRQERWV